MGGSSTKIHACTTHSNSRTTRSVSQGQNIQHLSLTENGNQAVYRDLQIPPINKSKLVVLRVSVLATDINATLYISTRDDVAHPFCDRNY